MTREEARLILGVYRCGKDDEVDPFFAEALQFASEDAELAKWFAAEQAFDARVAAGLAQGAAPTVLKTTLLAVVEPGVQPFWKESPTPAVVSFPRALALAAACTVAAALLTFAFVRPRAETGGQLADFRAEMVSFLLPPPSLALESSDLGKVQSWLAQHGGATPVQVPAKAQGLPPVGCRMLVFRGHRVGLICFERSKGRLVHLLVVERAAFAAASLPRERTFAAEGEWMTASWSEGEKLYVLAAQGDREALEQFF